ncbi:MAG: hypothetical protein HY606_03820 [Planctomycetes bacterium]|nr:hypothetical protein [Planctomycetota bacterium]
MKCQKCGDDIRDNTGEICEKCKGPNVTNIPPAVFLNQIGGGQYSPPTNITLQTFAGKELAKKKFGDLLLGLGLIVILTLVVGLILFLLL